MKQLIAFAAVALATTVFAGGPDGGARMRGRGPMGSEGGDDPVIRMVSNPRIAEKIGLSEEQRAKIKEIDTANRASNAELRKQLREATEKQAELLKAETIDEAAVMAEIDKVFDARKAMAKSQTKRIISIKSILTPEQVEKALDEFKNRPQRGARGRKGKGPEAAPECKGPECQGSECKEGKCPDCEGPGCKEGKCPDCKGPECHDCPPPCEKAE